MRQPAQARNAERGEEGDLSLFTVADDGQVKVLPRRKATQLRATLNECVDPAALRDWSTTVPGRAEFFAKKVDGLTAQKIMPA
jgi:hypothetical protein